MNRRLRFALLSVCGLLVGVLLLIVVRERVFDTAALALKTEEYSVAVPRLKVLAWCGDGRSQYVLGDMYATGVGVEKNDSRAIYWFRKAAVGAHGEADPAAASELAVARYYAVGTGGVMRDDAESLKWLRRAAEGGSQEANVELQKSRPPH
jgi:TPR repeat protein